MLEPGADMTFATLSTWVPFTHPDASLETLSRLLLPEDGKGHHATPIWSANLSSSIGTMGTGGMVNLGPKLRRSAAFTRRRSRMTATGLPPAKVFSSVLVARGLAASRAQQVSVLDKVCARSSSENRLRDEFFQAM